MAENDETEDFVVPLANGQNLTISASNAFVKPLLREYAKEIDDAINAGNYKSLERGEAQVSNGQTVQQLIVDYTTADNSPVSTNIETITNILMFNEDSDTGSAYSINIDNNSNHNIEILDGVSRFSRVRASGTSGGTYVAPQGSHLVMLDQSQADWTVTIFRASSGSSPAALPANPTGLNVMMKAAIQTGGSVITGGSGTNRFSITGGASNLVGLGSGINYLQSDAPNVTVYGSGLISDENANFANDEQVLTKGTSYGTDNVTITGVNGYFDLGQNASVSDLAASGGQIKVQTNSTIVGGQGAVVTFDNAGGNGFISGTTGDTISALGDLFVTQGTNQSISVAGALGFLNGTGDTTLSGGDRSTIWGASGLNATSAMTGYSIFTGNQPGATGDQTYDASASTGNLEYWSGAGNSTFIGGSGDDHIVFGTAFEGTSGDSNATVTGGSGANSFGVLAGHTGGTITITDFDPSKGDFFYEYLYKPTDPTKAVQDLLDTATVSDGNTTLHLDNNMSVTFLGVSQLDPSAIRIS